MASNAKGESLILVCVVALSPGPPFPSQSQLTPGLTSSAQTCLHVYCSHNTRFRGRAGCRRCLSLTYIPPHVFLQLVHKDLPFLTLEEPFCVTL